MMKHMCSIVLRKILLVLASFAIIAGCASFEKQDKPDVVPEIRPGILQGYLPSEMLPNSLGLLPPPPAAGSTAFALDKEVSRNSLALRGTLRWDLAAEDANMMFSRAAGTFSTSS